MIYLPNTIYIASIITYNVQQQISDASKYTGQRESNCNSNELQVCSRFLQNSETPAITSKMKISTKR